MLSVLRDLLLSLLVALALLSLQSRNLKRNRRLAFALQVERRSTDLLLRKRLEIRRILGISLPASRTQLVLVRSDSMPAEPTNLVATGTRIETQVVDLERFHAEGAFGQVITAGIHYVHGSSLFFLSTKIFK